MKKNKKAESLVAIIIWIFILSFALFWIISILTYNKDVSKFYWEEIDKYMIESNTNNIIKKIDTSAINTNETFYLHKNEITKEYEILTWAINEEYKYIDNLWNKVIPGDNIWKTYTREFKKNLDILRNTIYPQNLPNLVFHFDAMNIDWSNNSTYSNLDTISNWNDQSGNNLNATQSTSSKKPVLNTTIIDWKPWIYFDWINDLLKIDQNILINDDWDGYYNRDYTQKSFAIVLKTWFDITSDQTIFEQWWLATWYNFMIHDWDLYAWIHNKATSWDYSSSDSSYHYSWDSWHKIKSVNLWEVIPDTTYFIMIVQDSSHINESWSETTDDNNNRLKIYLNWFLISEASHVDPQAEHWKIWLWAINENNVDPWPPNDTIECIECRYFQWAIWEFISWNHALTEAEVRWVQNYFTQKWLRNIKSINYNLIDSTVKKFNNY